MRKFRGVWVGRPGDTVEVEPIQVRLRKDETGDRMIKRFMKDVKNSGVLGDHVRSLRFEKPSDRRRRKRAAALRGNRK